MEVFLDVDGEEVTGQLKGNLKRKLGLVLVVGGAAGIAAATLTPSASPPASTSNVFCLICGELAGVDALLNVALFVPFGAGLALIGAPRRAALLVVVLTTLAIEVMQVALLPGRDASLADLLSNSTGGIVGLVLAARARDWLVPSAITARRVLLGWMVAWLVGQAGATYALQPDATASAYFGQIARELGRPPYSGRVVTVTMNGEPLRDRDYDSRESARLRAMIKRSDALVVHVVTVPRDLTAQVTAIARLVDAEQRELWALSADGADVLFGVRNGARVLRLRPLIFRLRGALGMARRDDGAFVPVRLRASYSSRASLSALAPPVRLAADFSLTPGLAWRLLLPGQTYAESPFRESVYAALWSFVLLLPAGYWLPFAVTRRQLGATAAAATAVVLAGLVALPFVMGLRAVATQEIAGSFGGLALGALIAVRARPRSYSA